MPGASLEERRIGGLGSIKPEQKLVPLTPCEAAFPVAGREVTPGSQSSGETDTGRRHAHQRWDLRP